MAMGNSWEDRKARIRRSPSPIPRILLQEVEAKLAGSLQSFIGSSITAATLQVLRTAVFQSLQLHAATGFEQQFEVVRTANDPNAVAIVPLNDETAEFFRKLHAAGKL